MQTISINIELISYTHDKKKEQEYRLFRRLLDSGSLVLLSPNALTYGPYQHAGHDFVTTICLHKKIVT